MVMIFLNQNLLIPLAGLESNSFGGKRPQSF